MVDKPLKTKKDRLPEQGKAVTRVERLSRPLNASKNALLVTLFKILVKGNHHYITPSRTSVLQILEKRYHISIKSRWLGECIRSLIDRGLIKRRRRWKHVEFSEIRSIPSMIVLTPSGISYLNMIGISGASDVWQRTLRWLKKGDGRFPYPIDGIGLTPSEAEDAGRARERRPSDTIYIDRRTEQSEALARLRKIISDIG